MSSEVL